MSMATWSDQNWKFLSCVGSSIYIQKDFLFSTGIKQPSETSFCPFKTQRSYPAWFRLVDYGYLRWSNSPFDAFLPITSPIMLNSTASIPEARLPFDLDNTLGALLIGGLFAAA